MKSKQNRMKEWKKEREEILKPIFQEKGISVCEVCNGKSYALQLSFHHRHERSYYYSRPKLRVVFAEVLFLCNKCHDDLLPNSDKSEEWFKKLRG